MKKKMNILIIQPGPKYNLEHAFKERCDLLSNNCAGSILTSGPSYVKTKFSSFKLICFRDPYGKSFISTFSFLFYGLYNLMMHKKTDKRFDMIVTYDPLKTGLIGLVLSRLTGTKLVVEVNGDYQNDWIYADIENRIKRRIKKNLMVFVERFVLRHADGIKLLYKNQIKNIRTKDNVVIGVFPDYVNAGKFQNFGFSKEILFVGFPMGIKGVDILISAFKRISSDNDDWKLKILGYYPDKSKLLDLIGENKNIILHDPVDPVEMPIHIGSCGIFVLPSRTEAMGRVLVEAMAAGKPRLGSQVGGIPTVIKDGVDGVLFKSEDVDDLAEKLTELIENPNYRNRLGDNARKRYQREFLPKHYFSKLTEFYQSILR